MKIYSAAILVAIIIAATNINCASSGTASQSEFEKLQWLIGRWDRTNTKEGRSAHERWEKVSDKELKGWGVSLRGTDTSFMEKLRIVNEGGNLFYVADVAENAAPVYFKFTEFSKNGFTCENADHDFPKKIQYILNGDSLKAITSGDGKELIFKFTKRN